MNRVELIGRLTKDVEILRTQKGTAVAHFSIALNDYVGGKERYRAYFFSCQLFGNNAENLGKYCKKGDQIGVYGKLVQREYTTKTNNKLKVIEIVCDGFDLLEPKKQGQTSSEPVANEPQGENVPLEDLNDEDLPF